MKKFIFFIFIIISTSLFGEVKIYEELPEGKWELRTNDYLICVNNKAEYSSCNPPNHALKLAKSDNYYMLKSDKNKCLRIGSSLSVQTCKKNNDSYLFSIEIIGQNGGTNNGNKVGNISFILKSNKNNFYLGKKDTAYSDYEKTKNIYYAEIFRKYSEELSVCENIPETNKDDEEKFYCSCGKGYYLKNYENNYTEISEIINNISPYKDYDKVKDIRKNNTIFHNSYCLEALKIYKQSKTLETLIVNTLNQDPNAKTKKKEDLTKVASNSIQTTTKTKTQTKTQTKKQTQTKQTTITIDANGYNDCILENMKNISSDEAAIAIKEACKSKYSSNSSQATSSVDSDFNKDPILIADIPKNLNACGSTTKTRFPIFTGC